jgi:hypothetical protein
MFENNTHNQHFLPRVEQKLNALNPQAKIENLRIYSFRLVDRERYSLDLESQNGRLIGSNLSLFDLFSFDVADGGRLRTNFESLFKKYGDNTENHTKSLLGKLNSRDSDIKAEIIDLFAAKLLNFVRNPFSIAKVLNTFPNLATFEPTNTALLASYRRIVSGKKPHQAYLCSLLGVSDQQYVEWLRVLFMLLTQLGDGHLNFFEEMIKRLLEDRKTQVAAFVWQYDDDYCLLSDRGYCQPIADSTHIAAFSFNLCSTAFIDYIFAGVETLMQGRASPDFLAHSLACFERRPEVTLNVTLKRNDKAMLARYNRRVIEQCHERVYCSVKEGLVLS